MPEWVSMLMCFGLLFAVAGFVLLLHFVDILKGLLQKAVVGGVLVYLVERFKK